MITALLGERIEIQYLEVNEVEARCWLIDYKIVGILDNRQNLIRPEQVGNKGFAQVISVNGNLVELH